MLFWDLVDVLIRRWYIIATWVAMIVVGATLALSTVPTHHQAGGQLLLLPPSRPVLQGERINPYLNLPNGLTLTASLLASTVNAPETARELLQDGYESAYTVVVVPGTGPLIAISVDDADPQTALALRNELIERLESELDRVQTAENVPQDQLMEARRFNVSDQVEVLAGNRLRAVAAIVALGLILAGFATHAAERRARRREEQAGLRDSGSPGRSGGAGEEQDSPNAASSMGAETSGRAGPRPVSRRGPEAQGVRQVGARVTQRRR